MNRTYRLIWNELTASYVPVAELTRSRGKRTQTAKALALAAALGIFTQAQAEPTGGQISAGSGSIAQTAAVTTISQSSQKLAINWNTFNIGANETVNFVQPNRSAIALNRVLGSDGTQILGQLNANGQVFVLNPNGVLFGKGAQVNVGGLVASTLQLSDSDFLAGKYSFGGTGGKVSNAGTITAADGGYVALIGNQVSNQGTIVAKLGTVALAAGQQVSLDFAGDGLLKLNVDQAALNALVTNQGLIQADGGLALMTAHAKDALLNTVVNNEGIVQARTVENHNGVIKLLGSMESGTVKVAGTLDASAPNGGDGGFIDTSGAHVAIDPTAKVTTLAAYGKTGNWLIDPPDFKIAATGGDMTGTYLSGQLNQTNMSILSSSGGSGANGDILVNDAVSWTANTTLTLSAYRNIEVNADISATGNTAGLVMTPGTGTTGSYNLNNGAKITLSGSTPSLNIAGHAYTVINDVNALQAMNNNLTGYYAQGSDIDASATSGWNGGAGFVPVGNNTTLFRGAFDGLNHVVNQLVINLPTTDYVGLFGSLSSSQIKNVGLVGGAIRGRDKVGGLAGAMSWTASIDNVFTTAAINGSSHVGGLVGNSTGVISNAYSSGAVTSSVSGAGGLVGVLGSRPEAKVIDSFSTGPVNGNSDVGGLVGNSQSANVYSISRSHSTGNVSGTINVGGLVGWQLANNNNSITDSYSTGNVTGTDAVGGLVGKNSAYIRTSTAMGNVNGIRYVGGLVGENYNGTVTYSYATGTVTGGANSSAIGGLVGSLNFGTISDSYSSGVVLGGQGSVNLGGSIGLKDGVINSSYWNNSINPSIPGVGYDSSGTTNLVGLSTSQMRATANYTGWNFSNIWIIYEGQTYPLLRSLMTPITVTANDTSKAYDGISFAGGNGVTYSTTPNNNMLGTLGYSGSSQGALNAGTYSIIPTGLYSNQQGYAITFVNGTLTVGKVALGVTANAASKTYDGLGYSGGNGVSYSTFVNNENSSVLGGTLAYGGTSQGATNAGSYTITPSGLTSGNYTITFNNGSLTIDKAALQVTANSTSKIYGDALTLGSTAFSPVGLQNNESIGAVTLASAGTAVSASVAGGPYAITPSNATGGTFNPANYNISYVNGVLTLSPANLTVAADNKTRDYGDANPAFTATATGLKAGDTNALISGLTTLALTSSDVGPHAIYASNASAGTNYVITSTTDGTLTIAPAPLTIRADDKTKIQTQANPPLTATYTGFKLGQNASALNGTLLLTTTAATDSAAGDYPINASGQTSTNYTIAYVDGTLKVLVSLAPTLPGSPADAYRSATAIAQSQTFTVGNSLGSNSINILALGPVAAPAPYGSSPSGMIVGLPLTIVSVSSSLPEAGQPSAADRPPAPPSRPDTSPTMETGIAPTPAPPALTSSGTGGFAIVVAPMSATGGVAGLRVMRGIPDMAITSGVPVNLTVSSDAFAHSGTNPTVTLSATQANGQPLPSWLRFDSSRGTFSGVPPPGFRSNVAIRVVARDQTGQTAGAVFNFRVGSSGVR